MNQNRSNIWVRTSPTYVVTLTANQYYPLYNSTLDKQRWVASAALDTAAGGKVKGDLIGGRCVGHIYCTAQNLTLGFKYLRADGTWDDAAAKPTQTVTAGTALPFSWLYSDYSADFMVYIQAGATPPSAIYYELAVLWDRSAGVS